MKEWCGFKSDYYFCQLVPFRLDGVSAWGEREGRIGEGILPVYYINTHKIRVYLIFFTIIIY